MKLANWARKHEISYGTALAWFHNNKLPANARQLSTGTILVDDDTFVNEESLKTSNMRTFIYARVSSSNKKADLKSQALLCESFCISKGWQISKVVKEIASGMNDNRPKLNKVLAEEHIRLVVLYKDRLTRFGCNYIEKAVKSSGGELVIINSDNNDEDDLLKDFIAVITSFCCRLYGARRGQAKALKMKTKLREE